MCFTKVDGRYTAPGSEVTCAPLPPGIPPEGDMDPGAIRMRILELRTWCARVEDEIAAAEMQTSAKVVDAGLDSLRQHTDDLQKLVDAKERIVQSLRLRAFSQLHELRLEERQHLSRCIALRRGLAAFDSDSTAATSSQDDGGYPATSQPATASADGWKELSNQVGHLDHFLAALHTGAANADAHADALKMDAVRADGVAAGQARQEIEALSRSIAEARAELARLREGPQGGDDDAAQDASLAILHDELSKLRENKRALEADCEALRRALTAAS